MIQAASGILDRMIEYLWSPIAMVIFSAGFLLFLWGLVKFMWHLEDGSDHEEGKQHMIWGIAGMFIMVSIWAIIGLLSNTFGLGVFDAGGAASDVGRMDGVGSVDFGSSR